MSIDPYKKFNSEINKLNNDELWKVSSKYKKVSVILIVITSVALSIILYFLFEMYIVIVYPWIFSVPACYFILTQKKSKYEQGFDIVDKYKDVHYDYESKE